MSIIIYPSRICLDSITYFMSIFPLLYYSYDNPVIATCNFSIERCEVP